MPIRSVGGGKGAKLFSQTGEKAISTRVDAEMTIISYPNQRIIIIYLQNLQQFL